MDTIKGVLEKTANSYKELKEGISAMLKKHWIVINFRIV